MDGEQLSSSIAATSEKSGGSLSRFFAWPLLQLIRFYKRFISPLKPPVCRFYPTCSTYTYEAITLYGPAKGSWMGAKRIARCQPFCEGGFDPVPGSPLHKRSQTDPAFLESVS